MTSVPLHQKRVVVLTNKATDMVLALGITPMGAVKSWSGNPYYEYIADEMATVPMVGDELQPNLEQIGALKPDLIIGSRVRQEQIYGQLSAIANLPVHLGKQAQAFLIQRRHPGALVNAAIG